MEAHPYHEALSGSWWCLVCRAPASIGDPGESSPVCGNCGKRRCEWQSQREAPLRLAPPPVFDPVPIDAQPMLNKRRLPSAQRPTLSQMTYEGYWRCLECEEPTKRGQDECCVLCGSSRVEFQPPTL